MKFKALRSKKEPEEFVEIHLHNDMTYMVYTGELPNPQPVTATIELLKNSYEKSKYPLPKNINLDDYELVEFEMYEANTVGADIRNKLSPPKTLVSLLEEYFGANTVHASEKGQDLYELIKKEMEQTKISIKYIAELL